MARKHTDVVVQDRLVALLRAVVARHDNDQTRAAKALDIHQSQVSLFLSGGRAVPANVVPAIAEAAGASLDEIYEVGPSAWSQLPGWESAEAQARALFPRVRTAAFKRVAAIRAPAPDDLDAAKIGFLASMYDKKVSDV